MLKEKIGLAFVALGVTTATADNNPLIPIAFMAVGLWLMRGMIGDDESAEDL